MPSQVSRAARGFTAIEIVVVLLIVMILAGMVVPAVATGVRSSKLRQAASETATALRRARSMAITEGEIYGVDMNRVVPVDELRDRAAVIRIHPAPDFSLQTSTSAGGAMLPGGVNFAGGSLTRLFFLPDGSAAVESGVTWVPVRLVYYKPGTTMSEPGRYEISVRPLTGRIEVSELKD